MAQQITIDIVAETKKLSQGLNDASSQVEGMNTKFKGLAAAAGAAASAFVLKQGVSFLKDGLEEAKDAEIAMNKATSAFGEGSTALKKITDDATKFGKALGVDNDDLIKLSTQLGIYLPADAKSLSAELVNLGYDISALTGTDPEAWVKKFAKGMADGSLKVGDLEKMVPGLTAAVYDQAAAMFEAGNAQGALNLLIEEGQKAYGDAAEKNVTASQKLDVALANLKETIGTKILPFVEKAVNVLTKLLDLFSALPGPVQNVVLALAAVVAIGGPLLSFFASAKTAMITLGIVTKAQTASQLSLNAAMLANPIGLVIVAIAAIIAIGVLLWKNWDTVKEYAGKLWDVIKNVFSWAKDNWPLLLAILTGPIGLAVLAITKNFDKIKEKVVEVVSMIKDKFAAIPEAMLNIGKNIVRGLWDGIEGMLDWLKNRLENSLVGKTISKVASLFGIKSPSTVFAEMGKNLVLGLAQGVDNAQKFASASMTDLAGVTLSGFQPQLAGYSGSSGAPINITINAGVGTDPYALGREVNNALTKYGKVSNRVVRG